MIFGRGYRPDPAHRRGQTDARVLLGGAGAAPGLPSSVSLLSLAPPVMDQGSSQACTGHASSVCLYVALVAAGSPLGFVPSPGSIYKGTRCYERAALTPAGATLPALEDLGCIPADVMESISTLGVRSMQPGSDGRYSDVSPDNVNTELAFADVEADVAHVLTGQYRVTAFGLPPGLIVQAKTLLAQGVPLFVGTYADQAFESWKAGDAPVGAPDMTTPGGGHALAVLGYQVDASGTAFLVRNSWGASWGEEGNVWCSAAWLVSCSDIYAMKTVAAT